jgi:prevent-host-death family protein
MPLTVNVRQAKAQFSRLLEQAHAGQEIILAKAGKPYARLMPLAAPAAERRPGRLKFSLSDKFFEALPEQELDTWEGPL